MIARRVAALSWRVLRAVCCLLVGLTPLACGDDASSSTGADSDDSSLGDAGTDFPIDDDADDDLADDDVADDDDVFDDDTDDDADDDRPPDAGGVQDAGQGDSDAAAPGGDAGMAEPDAGPAAGLELEQVLVDSLLTAEDPGYESLSHQPSRELRPMVTSPCGGPITHGQLLSWTPEQDGTLHLAIDTGSPHVSLLQTDCGVPNTTKDCLPQQTTSRLSAALIAGQPLCVIVGYEDDAIIQAQIATANCGDGVLNPATEQCDYGDLALGDGCDEFCQFEPPPEEGNLCPGDSQTLIDTLSLSGFTVGYTDNAPASCGALGSAADKIYNLIPDADGTVSVSAAPDPAAPFDLALSVFTGCEDGNQLKDLLACSDAPIASATEQLQFPVQRLKQYYLVIDGYSQQDRGAFDLQVQLLRAAAE